MSPPHEGIAVALVTPPALRSGVFLSIVVTGRNHDQDDEQDEQQMHHWPRRFSLSLSATWVLRLATNSMQASLS